MKKLWIHTITGLLILVCCCIPAFAADYLNDYAGYLSEQQASALEQELALASAKLTAHIRLVTENDMSGATPESTAQAYADALNDTGDGLLPGILLYVCRSQRVYYVDASRDIFNDTMLTAVEDQFLPYMRENDYFHAFEAYLDETVQQIVAYHGETPNFPLQPYPTEYDNEAYPVAEQPFSPNEIDPQASSSVDQPFRLTDLVFLLFDPIVFLVVIVVPLLAALFLTHLKVKQMNTAVPKTTADSFVKQGSLSLTESRDIFLYSTVVRKPKPKGPTQNRSTGVGGGGAGTGSGGRIGHGGSF